MILNHLKPKNRDRMTGPHDRLAPCIVDLYHIQVTSTLECYPGRSEENPRHLEWLKNP
jgi:hypothetical protein